MWKTVRHKGWWRKRQKEGEVLVSTFRLMELEAIDSLQEGTAIPIHDNMRVVTIEIPLEGFKSWHLRSAYYVLPKDPVQCQFIVQTTHSIQRNERRDDPAKVKCQRNFSFRKWIITLKYLTVFTFSSSVASSSQIRRARGCCWTAETVHIWLTPSSTALYKAKALCAPVINIITCHFNTWWSRNSK